MPWPSVASPQPLLRGKEWVPEWNEWAWKTESAAEYPEGMCVAMAKLVKAAGEPEGIGSSTRVDRAPFNGPLEPPTSD